MKDHSIETSASIRSKLRTLLIVLGKRRLRELLDADSTSLSEALGDPLRGRELATRIIDTEYVVSRAALIFVGAAVGDWLFGHSPAFLARPIDVLKTDEHGPSLLVDELRRIAAGGYA